MNKNIFAFEHFGDKIIPVGYLANNKDTPLKFDVITRDPDTWEIEKVNYGKGREKRPLTFCEAMRYTGKEFSSYCGCKNDGVTITKYDSLQNNPCDNSFGCKIRPVKPAINKRF
ncbi:MAG: hypothetical protein BHW64_05425 [Candidatus Melainabacteria bacterium LEY3_CP_29_8]|nr:MAG: hypothetical protein BHW64_05425 [Candidatus Melainabacteria bacterium LEY3_CP_29_8]